MIAALLNAPVAVVPVLTGPIQALLALAPWLLATLFGGLLWLFRPRVMWLGVKLLWRVKLSVLAVAAVLAGGYALWAAYGPGFSSRGAVATVEKGEDWPLFRGGPARTGCVDDGLEPVRPKLAWMWKDGGTAIFSSPAVVGNRVHVTTALTGLFGKGRILCFDADTGELVWETAPPGFQATFSSPVVSGDRLVCGEGLHFTKNARVVCVDLADRRQGKILWTYRTKSHVECTPVIHEGRVYVGAGDDGYYCFELEPDETGAARVVWHTGGENYPDAETSLIVHEGLVYAGLGRGGQAICVLDAATGKEIKRMATDYPVFSPPAIAEGKLFVGMGAGDYVYRAEELDQKPAGAVWCIDLASLEPVWKYPVGRTVLGAVAVRGGRVYFGARDGVLHCLDTDGRLVGKWNAYAPIVTGPAVTERLVCVVTDAGVLYALDRQTLEPRWEFPVSSGPLLFSSPAVARGRVYLGTEHDGLLAVGEPGAWSDEPKIPVWPAPLGGPQRCGAADDSSLPELGAMHWQYPADQTGETDIAAVVAPPAVVDGRLFVALAMPIGDEGRRGGLVAIAPKSEADEPPTPDWVYETDLPVIRSPLVCGDRLLLTHGTLQGEVRRLFARKRSTGGPRWSKRVASPATGAVSCAEREIFAQLTANTLSCFDPLGQDVWSQEVGRMDHPPATVGQLVVAAASDPPALTVLDRPTGKILWKGPLAAKPTAAPFAGNEMILVPTASGFEARNTTNGRPVSDWRREGGGVSAEFFVGQNVIAYISVDGELTLLSRKSGKRLGKVPGALPGFAPLPCRERLLYLADGAIMAVTFDETGFTGAPQQWADTSWLGKPTTSMTLSGGAVYVGMEGWGLVRWGAE